MALRQVSNKIQIPTIEQIERSVHVLDKGVKVRFIPFKLPVDPILGLVPFFGDMVTLVLSGTIISHARKHGVPPSIQRMMFFNVVTDCVIGAIPVIGDIFDFFHKANVKNLKLLKNHLALTPKKANITTRR